MGCLDCKPIFATIYSPFIISHVLTCAHDQASVGKEFFSMILLAPTQDFQTEVCIVQNKSLVYLLGEKKKL